MDELRIFMVVRRDLPLSALGMIDLAAEAVFGAFQNATVVAPEAAALYAADEEYHGKIALGAKNANALERSRAECAAAGLPSAMAFHGNEPACLGVGPCRREDLPDFVRRMQLFPLDWEPGAAALPSPDAANTPVLFVALRADLAIPLGKLLPQTGHATLGAYLEALKAGSGWAELYAGAARRARRVILVKDKPAIEALAAACAGEGVPHHLVVDQGRTYFPEPTMTCLGVGPVPLYRVPQALNRSTAAAPGWQPALPAAT